jgi:hypothetical protein
MCPPWPKHVAEAVEASAERDADECTKAASL